MDYRHKTPLSNLRGERSSDAKTLGEFLYFTLAGNAPGEVERMAKNAGASQRTVELLEKTSSPAFDSSNLTSPYSQAISRMIAQHGPRGAYESMRPGMVEVPLRSRFIVSSAQIVGGEVAEGAAKPIRRVNITNLDSEVSKFAAAIAVSIEAIKESPELTQRLIADALPRAVSVAADTFFLGKLQGEEVGESSGEVNPTWAQVLNDLEELLRLVQTGSSSDLWYLMQPRVAKYLSRLAYENGISTVKYDSGEIFGVKIAVTEGITSGRVTLADASAIAFGEVGTEVRQSDQCSVELLDNPTNKSATSVTATNMVSAFQTNMRVLMAETSLAVRVIDTQGIATLTGVQWGAGADSPAI